MQSKFTGGLLGYIGISIAKILLIVCTLFIATPWAVCLGENWKAQHTVIDGQQVLFKGTGGQLFGEYIKWFLLSIVTFGIYTFWLKIKMEQWVVSKTHLANTGAASMPKLAASIATK